MDTKEFLFVLGICFACCLYLVLPVSSGTICNEAVCASIVSKCMLTQSCKCDAKNTSCSKDCFYCLDYLYSECCSCVEMCPPSNNTEILSQTSHVEDLAEPFPDLFAVLTEEKDRLLRWTSYTFPTQASFITMDKEVKFIAAKPGTTESAEENVQVNCTVAYMSQCTSFNKCKNSCSSMGASSYRWFHDGCCECVGSTCVNYGINESRCLECSELESSIENNPQEIDGKSANKSDKDAKKKLSEEEEKKKYSEEAEETESLSEKDDEPVEKMQNIDV